MSEKMKDLVLTDDAIEDIYSRISALEKDGVNPFNVASGEMNFSGCKKGYCQAWD